MYSDKQHMNIQDDNLFSVFSYYHGYWQETLQWLLLPVPAAYSDRGRVSTEMS